MDSQTYIIKKTGNIRSAYTLLFILVAWFALVVQFTISILAAEAKGDSLAFVLIQLISFFTILTNILAAKSLTIQLFAPESYWGRFFSKPSVQTAITSYMTILGLVYWAVLRNTWKPQGWFKVADELLHTINPLLFIIYWLAFVPKSSLVYKHVLNWLWYPLIYLIYIIVRGAICHRYPYYFVDVDVMGYSRVLIHCLALLLLFTAMSVFFVWIGHLIARPEKTAPTV
jgi:hypothetical protein